ncbi:MULTISPECIES: SRPBCC domain-containing protein [unclassified Microbacterium]|uniref:SRPBCC domain-containing protein n=1 Tax=unclassified Microbacterium TaxID=2609290 RepID=UPI00214BF034|nr:MULTISPECIES: SRPBCC domain-containing protein [unclassified Microbacterium]MCR2809101.1 SRPBCC domain-containing protein [Microbacterium sp. zg.B185]WIM20255.1 SRPBCC domain-containing protein [Microbacterium sp. zg-B185]
MSEQKLLGELREENGSGVVRVEDVYATGIDDLWSAITEPDRLARWIAQVSGDLRVGGEFDATFTSGWVGTGRIEVCAAPTLLRVRTQQPGEQATVMEAQLGPAAGGTRLVIEERGLPLAEYAGHGAGWQAHVEDLHAHIAGTASMDWMQRWRELSPAYVALVSR